MANTPYTIKLGVDFDKSELKNIESKINNLTDNTHRIRIDFDTSRIHKQFDHIEKRFKNLAGTKGNVNAVPISTGGLEKSLGDVASTIKEIKDSMGTLDSKSGMKSLLSSINQISTALEKAGDQFEELNRSMDALSRKDFSFNFNFKTGNTNPAKAMSDYGRAARDEAIPALEQQVRALQELIGGYDKADKELQNYMVKMYQLNGMSKKNDLLDKAGGSGSLQEQMSSLKKLVNIYKEIASQKGYSLDNFNATYSKSAENIVDDTTKIQTGAKQTEEALEQMGNELRQVFGTGIDGENLSRQLTSIVDDLKEIRTVIESLSSNNPFDGLTQSFNRLSEVLEQVMANAKLVQDVLGGGVTGVDTGSDTKNNGIYDDVGDSQKAVNDARRTGQEIGDALDDSLQKSINTDDIIDKEVSKLLDKYSIISKRGEKAFDEVREAIIQCRRELSSMDDVDVFDSHTGIERVISALANNMKVPNDMSEAYVKAYQPLKDHITKMNNSGAKFHLPDTIKQEFGDDYRSMRAQLGKAFTTGKGQDFENFIDELNSELGQTIDLSHGAEAAFEDLFDKITTYNQAKKNMSISGDDVFNTPYADIDEMEASVIGSLGVIEEGEKQAALASMNAADSIAQSQQKKRQAYQETANEYGKIRTAVSPESFDNLDEAFDRFKFDDDTVQSIIRDFDDLGVTIKKVTTKLNDDGSINLTVKGIDDAERAVTVVKKVRKELDESGEWTGKFNVSDSTTIAQKFDEVEQNYKRMLSLAKQMGDIDVKLETLDVDKNANEIKELKSLLNSLESEYIDLDNTFGKSLSTEQLLNLNRVFDGTSDKLQTIKARLNDAFEMDKAAQEIREQEVAFNRLLSIMKQMDNLEVKIAGLDSNKNSGEINELISQLNRLEAEFNELYATVDKNMTFDQADVINKQLTDTANKIQLTKAKLEDARNEMARKIKLNIEAGDFDKGLRKVEDKLSSLSSKTPKAEKAVNELRQALNEMNAAFKAGDNDGLIRATEKYEAALKKANNQLDEHIKKQKENVAKQKLEDDSVAFRDKIDAWLTKNSKAATQFGDRLLDLRAKAESCDRVTLDHLEREFKQIDKEAEAAGVKMMNLPDRLKHQFSKYSTYFSAASVFMYLEQGLRSAFEQVVAIDSAMTELKKVTDETSHTYSRFLTDASGRASEIGTTIDGLITSTADFARLGYEFKEATNLAEVANIYTVVGDEIDSVDTATQSVISTLKAFKDEASNISAGDFAMDIVDKFNEVSNNFAISSGGIGEALTRSASSMAAANNTLDETIALTTAAM